MHMPRLGFASLMGLLALLLWFLGGVRAYGGLRGWVGALFLVPLGVGLGLGRRAVDEGGDPFAPASERGRASPRGAGRPRRPRFRIGALMILVAVVAVPAWVAHKMRTYGSLWNWTEGEILDPLRRTIWPPPEDGDDVLLDASAQRSLKYDRNPSMSMTYAESQALEAKRAASGPAEATSDPPEFIRLPPRGDREPPKR